MKTETIVNGSPKFTLSDGIEARFLRQADGTLELAIVWGAETAVSHTLCTQLQTITHALPYLQADKVGGVLKNMQSMKRQGWSYGGIGTHINLACLAHLTHANDDLPKALKAATTLLKAVRVKDEIIAYTLLPMLVHLQAGELHWQDEPANNQRVRDALRNWKGKDQPSDMLHPDMSVVEEMLEGTAVWRAYQKQAKRGR